MRRRLQTATESSGRSSASIFDSFRGTASEAQLRRSAVFGKRKVATVGSGRRTVAEIIIKSISTGGVTPPIYRHLAPPEGAVLCAIEPSGGGFDLDLDPGLVKPRSMVHYVFSKKKIGSGRSWISDRIC